MSCFRDGGGIDVVHPRLYSCVMDVTVSDGSAFTSFILTE